MIDLVPLRKNPLIDAVVLFGSKARGDSDVYSDIDLAVFAGVSDLESLVQLKGELDEVSLHEGVNVSLYSTRTAETLAKAGSLFLWHLKTEGKILFDRRLWIASLLAQLEPYSKAKALGDLQTFREILDDCRYALERSGSTVRFEAAMLFCILRNAGMIYSQAEGHPCFGRVEPILLLSTAMGGSFPLNELEVSRLENLRIGYARVPSMSLENPTVEWCFDVSNRVAQIISFVTESIDARKS